MLKALKTYSNLTKVHFRTSLSLLWYLFTHFDQLSNEYFESNLSWNLLWLQIILVIINNIFNPGIGPVGGAVESGSALVGATASARNDPNQRRFSADGANEGAARITLK